MLAWEIDATARPGAPGEAIVKIDARLPPNTAVAMEIAVDWRPGQERADVEAFALDIAALLFRGLYLKLSKSGLDRIEAGD